MSIDEYKMELEEAKLYISQLKMKILESKFQTNRFIITIERY